MAGAGSPFSKLTIKWQVALAVGLPVAVGVGYWYLNSKNKKIKPVKLEKKSENINCGISIDRDISANVNEEQIEKTPLEKATLLKEEGNKWFRNSKFNEAIASYEKAIEICPETETISLATFYQNKAAAYEQLQKYEDVKTACAKALSLNPKYTKALLRRAKACELTQDLTQALEDVITACILENFQSQSTLLLADRLLKDLGRIHTKEAMANRVPVMPSVSHIKTSFMAFDNDPINSFISKTEGDFSRGFLKAIDCFKKEEYESIIPACTEEINLTEAEAVYKNEALLLRATFYEFTGENNSALADLDIVINNEEANPRLRANALIKRASINMHLEDITKCMDDLNSAITIDPNNCDIFHHRGQVHLATGKLNNAADDFNMAISLNPENPIILVQKYLVEYRLASLAKDSDAINSVLQKFEEIIKQYPDFTESYAVYSQVLCDQQEFEKGDELFQKAIEVDPKNAVLYARRAMFILQWNGDVETAAKCLNTALALDDKCEYAYETLGIVEIQRGNLAKAIEMFDKVIPLIKTEMEMSHIFSLRGAAIAQKTVAEKMNIKNPRNIF